LIHQRCKQRRVFADDDPTHSWAMSMLVLLPGYSPLPQSFLILNTKVSMIPLFDHS
jgi:hypothetical protein